MKSIIFLGALGSALAILPLLINSWRRYMSPFLAHRRSEKLRGVSEYMKDRVEEVLDLKLHSQDIRFDTKLAPILSELQHNGGGSVKDAVKRIEDNQTSIQLKTETTAATSAAILAGVDMKIDGVLERVKGVATEVRVLSQRLDLVEKTRAEVK